MKIQQLNVERCGGWRDVSLPLASDGLTVLYGPNEAGKSTLLRFIRGVLFGFDPEDEAGPGARPQRLGCAGELLATHRDEEYTIRRESGFEGRSGVRITTRGAVLDAVAAMEDLRGGVPRAVFEGVFALGLSDLQRLGTLPDDEVARLIYEMSLGRDGQRVVAAWNASEDARKALWDTETDVGELLRLSSALDDLDRRLADAADADAAYLSMRDDRARLLVEVEDQRARRRGLQEQLRGHEFLERIWGPWRRQQALTRQREAVQHAQDFPEDGVSRLNELDLQLADLQRRRTHLREEHRRARNVVAKCGMNDPVRPHAAAVRRLAGQSAAVAEMEVKLPAKRQQLAEARGRLDACLRLLGTGWGEQRLDDLNSSPAATRELFDRAGRFRAALKNRSRRIRRYQHWSAALQRRQGEQATALPDLDGRTVDELREELVERIGALEQIERLQMHASARSEAVAALQEQLTIAAAPRQLPPYFYSVLALLGFGGAMLLGIGVYRAAAGIASGGQWMFGLILALLGICGAGLTWTMKRQFEASDEPASRLRKRLEIAEEELGDIRRDLARRSRDFRTRPALRNGGATTDAAVSIEEQLNSARDELTQLDAAIRNDATTRRRREQVATLRSRIRDLQRTVSAARLEWCQALTAAGLDESIQIAASLKIWETAHEAKRRLSQWRIAEDELSADEAAIEAFHRDVSVLAVQIDGHGGDDPHSQVATWSNRCDALVAARHRRQSARRELRQLRDAGRQIRREFRRAAGERRSLLQGAGANDRESFLAMDRDRRQYCDLTRQLESAREDLAAAAQTEPHLAVVEEDLRAFDPAHNRLAIDTLRCELADLERDQQSAHERLGELNQALQAHEADRTVAELQFERAQLEHEWDAAVTQWSAVTAVRRGLDVLRTRFERECQPEILEAASRYLRALTADRYRRVWTPLAERRLVVDDPQQQSLRVEQLSSGTREQLLLAIRLALVDQFRERGVELPLILDDVLVNFDQRRTEAAIDTLVEYARGGRQVLMFTCHVHLAGMCEDSGVRTIRLPDPATEQARRRVG